MISKPLWNASTNVIERRLMRDVNTLPCIVALDKFAQKLPVELRAELYEHVKAFLHVGGGNGATLGASSFASMLSGGKAIETNQEALVQYLSKKQQENTTPVGA